jgi:septum formation protein
VKRIVLASASPRRRELLQRIGLEFEVDPSDYVEDLNAGLSPHELARSISLEKARLVAARHTDAVVIAADTIVVLGGRIIGQPGTDAEARSMLTRLNGKPHSVVTGFTVLDTGENRAVSGSVETTVHVKRVTSEEIEAYVASKEPLGKAGGYAIQGLGSVLVDRIEGDYFNVVGLPLSALAETLKEFGIRVL